MAGVGRVDTAALALLHPLFPVASFAHVTFTWNWYSVRDVSPFAVHPGEQAFVRPVHPVAVCQDACPFSCTWTRNEAKVQSFRFPSSQATSRLDGVGFAEVTPVGVSAGISKVLSALALTPQPEFASSLPQRSMTRKR